MTFSNVKKTYKWIRMLSRDHGRLGFEKSMKVFDRNFWEAQIVMQLTYIGDKDSI